jgi:hypothetical protein
MSVAQVFGVNEIMGRLIQQYGLQEAYAKALLASADAAILGDNYSLSVWREVKYRLRIQLTDTAEMG